jgi:hypothetical protein
VSNVPRPVSAFALDAAGRAWYLAPIPNGVVGFGYAPADGSQGVRSIPGAAFGLVFNAEQIDSAGYGGYHYRYGYQYGYGQRPDAGRA